MTIDIDVNVLDATGDRILAGEELQKENVLPWWRMTVLMTGAIEVSECEIGKCGDR